jgi:pyruvate/2-oxoacid:ferredoxin oxidoreductase beta subunit
MKKFNYLLLPILMASGCAQTISDDVAAKYATQISDSCKAYASASEAKGYRLIPAYSECIDRALNYLKYKNAKSTKRESNNFQFSIYDLAKNIAEDKAKEKAQDLAKNAVSKL